MEQTWSRQQMTTSKLTPVCFFSVSLKDRTESSSSIYTVVQLPGVVSSAARRTKRTQPVLNCDYILLVSIILLAGSLMLLYMPGRGRVERVAFFNFVMFSYGFPVGFHGFG
jgi:hypothetical protein